MSSQDRSPDDAPPDDGGRPGRAVLRDAAGHELLSYVTATHDERPLATDVRRPDDVSADRVADAVLAQLPGWAVSAPDDLATALVARGAVVQRRLRVMTRSLRTDPPPADWADAPLGAEVRAVPADRPAADLFPAWRAAYPAGGHVDAYPGDDAGALAERLVPLLAGAHGAVLPWSLLAVDGRDAVVGGVVVLAAEPPVDMPWIGDVFAGRDRSTPGSARPCCAGCSRWRRPRGSRASACR